MWENNNFTLTLKTNPFYHHEQMVLTCGEFDGFLPMSFIMQNQAMTVRYSPSGYAPLCRYRIERTKDALYLFEKTLLVLQKSPEHLIAPERVTLRTETIFYNRQKDHLKIAFLPQAGDPGSLHQHLLLFLTQLKKDLKDPNVGILDRMAREICRNSLDLRDMIRTVGQARRELELPPKQAPEQ